MPRLPRLSGRKLKRAMERGGFEVVRITGGHAYLHNPETDRRAVVPLTSRTLPVGTIANALRQAGLTGDDLRSLLK